ncbi:MAG: SDR family NAD(P)-dependent oxidoreductase [Fibrella sp.]|nr:SDR family NAD(P)-dependent oxidoreductase [Armatimonadota bacterium]
MSRFQPKPLQDQVVVITGASSGIGRKAAHLLAEKGASIVLAARNEVALNETAREVTERGGRALVVPTDVSDKAQVEALAEQAVSHFGRVDTWVNNAAVSTYAYLRTQPVEDIEQVFAVNVLGTIHGSRAAIPHLSRNGGTLINVGSILSERAIPLQGIYCASKHAVKGFTEALRMELDHEEIPINVTLIKPSVIDTPFYTQAKSLTGRRPRALPPIYDVSVPAGAIVSACGQYHREIYAGGSAAALGALQRLSPEALDTFMKHSGGYFGFFEGQLSDEPDDGRSNLYRPEPGTGSTTGNNAPRSKSVAMPSVYTAALELPPVVKQGLACVAVGAIAALLYNRKEA